MQFYEKLEVETNSSSSYKTLRRLWVLNQFYNNLEKKTAIFTVQPLVTLGCEKNRTQGGIICWTSNSHSRYVLLKTQWSLNTYNTTRYSRTASTQKNNSINIVHYFNLFANFATLRNLMFGKIRYSFPCSFFYVTFTFRGKETISLT